MQITNLPNPHTRFANSSNNAHPHITGYWYLHLDIPESIRDSNISHISLFNSTAIAFTPPSRSVETGEIVAFSNIKKQVITSQTISPRFSIRFNELFNTPISQIIKRWSNRISSTTGAITKDYKTDAFVIIAKPTISGQDTITSRDVEEVFFFHGVFPVTDVADRYESDITNNGLLELTIEFSFDGHFIRNDVGLTNEFVNQYVSDLSVWKPFTETI